MQFEKTNPRSNVTAIVTATALQRFGHYGVRSLLIIHLITNLGIADTHAGQIYGRFYGSLFFSSIIGGYLGDRRGRYFRVGSIGLLCIAVGQLFLAVGTIAATDIALTLYSIGFGLFDTNMNAIIGRQFHNDEHRRNTAYTVLYTAINVGAMAGPLLCGYIAVTVSYKYGFIASGISTCLALILFTTLSKSSKESSAVDSTKETIMGDAAEPKRMSLVSSQRLVLITLFAIVAVLFWAVFDQLGSSITLLAERFVRRRIGSFVIPAGYIQTINPLLVILLGPLLAFLLKLKWFAERQKRPTGLISVGILFLGSGFGLLALGAMGIGTTVRQAVIGWAWLFAAILLATIGELLFAPIALSAVAGLAPSKQRAFIVGAWAATFGVGAYLSGTMSGFMNTFRTLSLFFGISAVVCWLAGISLWLVMRFVEKSVILASRTAGVRG